MEEAPLLFRCPISMELMQNPVTISTGVTYERKNIQKWLFTYKKSTCPATMQLLDTFDLTPNHTLQRLIESWWQHDHPHHPNTQTAPIEHDKLVSLLSALESTPFQVNSLKRLQSIVESSHEVQNDFVSSGGIQTLARIMSQVAVDFSALQACEEALGVLHRLPLSDRTSAELISKNCIKPMMLILQRGSSEARLHTMNILQKLSNTNKDWVLCDHQEIDVIKSLLELLSDEISTKLSSCSLDVLIEIVTATKRNRIKAIEAGAVWILIELLPDASRHKCEKILLLMKKLCECPEGRGAFADHGLGVAAVSKKVLRVSEVATKLGVKILWLVSSFRATERVVEDMVVFGSVKKLIGLLHMVEGSSSTKNKALKMIRLHGGVWRQYSCFPCELKEYLRIVHQESR